MAASIDKNRLSRIYGYGIERLIIRDENKRIEENPNNQYNRKDRDKGPGATKGSDLVSKPLAKSQLLRKVLRDISRNMASLGEMTSNFLFSLTKLFVFRAKMLF